MRRIVVSGHFDSSQVDFIRSRPFPIAVCVRRRQLLLSAVAIQTIAIALINGIPVKGLKLRGIVELSVER